jgi:hypothetical protein
MIKTHKMRFHQIDYYNQNLWEHLPELADVLKEHQG